jgi:hypothetical protein
MFAIVAIILSILSIQAQAVQLPPPTGYSSSDLIFEDQFLSASLDTTAWNPWLGDDIYGRWGDLGQLPAPYSGPNCDNTCSDSLSIAYNDPFSYGYNVNTTGIHLGGASGLAIIAKPSNYFSNLGYSWASSAITSYSHVYMPAAGGYIQWHAKMPDSRYGAWAALWMLSTGGAEMDMQESGYILGASNPNNVLAMNWHGGGTQIKVDTGVDLSADFHTYGLELRPGTSIKMYLDGNLMATYTESIPTNANYQMLMDQEFAGPNAAGWHTLADAVNHPGPFTFNVDDVQVYGLPGGGGSIGLNSLIVTTTSVKVKARPQGVITRCTQPTGAQGTVVGGPRSGWWYVDFVSGCSGWVPENDLMLT